MHGAVARNSSITETTFPLIKEKVKLGTTSGGIMTQRRTSQVLNNNSTRATLIESTPTNKLTGRI